MQSPRVASPTQPFRDGLFAAVVLAVAGLVLRWLGADTVEMWVLAAAVAPLGWACGESVKRHVATRRPDRV